MARIYLSLGSNIQAETHILQGLDALAKQFGELILSPAVESEPVGFVGDNFINLMAVIHTDLPLKTLSQQLRQIEFDYGREINAPKFSGRTLDIDVVMVDRLEGAHEGLTLPRKDLFEHGYMLYPMSLMEPELVPPGQNLTTEQLWQDFSHDDQKLWLTPLVWQGTDISNGYSQE